MRRIKMSRNYLDWSNEQCLALIEEYKNHPILWNASHPAHYNIPQKRLAWQEMSDNLQADLGQTKQKITSLLGSFRRERSREKKAITTDTPYKSKWYAYQPMQFLCLNDIPDREFLEHDINADNIKMEFEEKSMHDILFENLSSQDNKRALELSINEQPKSKKLNIRILDDVQIIQSLPFSNEEILANLKEECSTYGQHVANKLLKYNSRTRAMVEHAINNIIFEADIGKYDEQQHRQFADSSAAVSTSYQQQQQQQQQQQHIEPDEIEAAADFIKTESGDNVL